LQKSAESLKPIDTRQELAKVAQVSHDTSIESVIQKSAKAPIFKFFAFDELEFSHKPNRKLN
jgi:hypothetical protein